MIGTLALVLTIAVSLLIGIGAGAAVVFGILHFFHPGREKKSIAAALVPSTSSQA